MSFGPLSTDGGERRLNVLISRAKERCEVFSSIVPDDIDLSKAKSRGARSLKTFLAYAKTGELESAATGGGEHESDFELEIARGRSEDRTRCRGSGRRSGLSYRPRGQRPRQAWKVLAWNRMRRCILPLVSIST